MSRETRRWWQRPVPEVKNAISYVRTVVSGTFYRVSDMRNDSCWSTIETVINTMDALERDSQIATALDYYATDSTLINTKGQVIWASPIDNNTSQAADIVNELFKRWDVHALARDHIRELAKLGNFPQFHPLTPPKTTQKPHYTPQEKPHHKTKTAQNTKNQQIQ